MANNLNERTETENVVLVHNRESSLSLVNDTDNSSLRRLVVISYNLHGFNQGRTGIKDLMDILNPDFIMVQEHWLFPSSLFKLDEIHDEYISFGSSAMTDVLGQGPFYGRPYGGTAIIMKRDVASFAHNIISNDRITAVKFSNWLLINVYMPCVGTANRQLLCNNILDEIQGLILTYPDCKCLIGGDLNVNLDGRDGVGDLLNNFFAQNCMTRCDVLFPVSSKFTYLNEALGNMSTVDYLLTSSPDSMAAFNILDLDVNLSDHLPIMTVCFSNSPSTQAKYKFEKFADVCHFRWDHAPLPMYYEQTRVLMQPILDELNSVENGYLNSGGISLECLDRLYNNVLEALCVSANLYIPKHKQNFYKFWWTCELEALKENAIMSCRIWKENSRPKSGPIFNKYRQDKMLYKRRLREEQSRELTSFSNDLHDALLRKSGQDFWKTWNSKFNRKTNSIRQVDGTSDSDVIAIKFAEHFEAVCSPFNAVRNDELKATYIKKRSTYDERLTWTDKIFTVESLTDALGKMQNGKAAGLDGVTCEHLRNSHPIVITILCKLFNVFVSHGHVPDSFGKSYTIPIPKSNVFNRALTSDDFRGITISPVISKLFEHVVLARFANFFVSSDNQFGFKKHLSCHHVIYNVRSIIDYYTTNGSTVNVCSLDLSKAFDKMNHYALFIKLMNKKLPCEILSILERWFSVTVTCVKWNGSVSHFFKLTAGVRQGGVLSPFLFATFIDSLFDKIKATGVGCYFRSACVSIFLYADDILLLAPSVTALQTLLAVCEDELSHIDMQINVKKSMCIRFGSRFNIECQCLVSSNGGTLQWVATCRYLGVYMVSGRVFRCSFNHSKGQFFKTFNSILCKVGGRASEEVVVSLLCSKCLPVLLYGVEACPVLARDKRSLEFTITRSFMKIFRTGSAEVVNECLKYFGFLPLSYQIDIRTVKFLEKFMMSDNFVCQLFYDQAASDIKKIYLLYGNNVSSISELLSVTYKLSII